MKLILGSQSPRRRELLTQAGLDYEILVPNADEKQITSSDPETKVIETARLKSSILMVDDDSILLTCDTVVSHNNKIYEKPATIEDARQMITALSGSTHEVYSAAILKSRALRKLFRTVQKSRFTSCQKKKSSSILIPMNHMTKPELTVFKVLELSL